MRRKSTILASICAALAAVTVACGGGDDSNADATPTATSTRPASTPTRSASATPVTSPGDPAATPTTVPPTASASVSTPDAPRPPTPPPLPTQPPPPPPLSITVVAKMLRFAPNALSAPAGATLNVTLDNQDAGVPHDIGFFDPSGAQVATTETATGPSVRSTVFTPAMPGSYNFECRVHPFQMTGTLTVQ